MSNAEAKNMEAIYKAKENHDATCPWRGEGQRIHMTPFDIERMGWEEGDVMAGLTLVADSKLATGRFEVRCDNEPDQDGPDMVIVKGNEVVNVEFKTNRDLVPA